MKLVLGYGSLLNVLSLQQTLGAKTRAELLPVRVPGVRRLFNLVSLSRTQGLERLEGAEVGVLNAVPDDQEEMGAVAFSLEEKDFAELDRREFCYHKVEGIPVVDFNTGKAVGAGLFYSVSSAAALKKRLPQIYAKQIAPLGADGLLSDRILPHGPYLTLCLQGAFSWGEAFGRHFLKHTYLADGKTPLTHYIREANLARYLSVDIESYIRERTR